MSVQLSNDQLVRQIITNPATRLYVFRGIEPNRQGFILLKLPVRIQKELMEKSNDKDILNFLNPLDPEKATDLLQLLPKPYAKKITEQLSTSIKEKVEFLLKFHPKAAAGLMNLNYILVQKNTKFEDIKSEVIKYEKRTGKFPTVLVVEDSKLIGEIPGSELVLHTSQELSANHIRKLPSIRYDSEVPKVINSFVRNPRNKVVILDADQSVLGIVHSHDILNLVDKNAMRDLYNFAGVDTEESSLDPAMTKVKFRYKWLIINLGTAFFAASVVGLFTDTISKFTILAAYMPIVAGMGGNAGTQAMAVAVRGLVLKEVELKTSKQLIYNEVKAGAVNGIINGVIVAMVAIIFNHSPKLGIVIGVAMISNLIVAGFFGSLIPMVMKALGKDPASSASIFITTATDVIGFFVFLGLASIIL